MCPYVNWYRTEFRNFGKQFLAIFHIRIIGLIVTKPGPNGFHWRNWLSEIYLNTGFVLGEAGLK
ncbi:hypothetical protein D3C85_717640 [compost metagenome]